MLVATVWKARTDISQEQVQQVLPRRIAWKPKGKIVAEFWFVGAQRGDWAGVTVADVQDPSQLFEDLAVWTDVLEMRSHVAVDVEQGLRMAQQAMAAATA